jgi:hypothetical protein
MKRPLTSLAAFLMFPNAAYACSVCFYGDPTQQANMALRQGIMALLLVLMVVLAALGCFFISVARRAKLQNTD